MANYFEDPTTIRLNDTDWQVLATEDYWKGPPEIPTFHGQAPLLSERCIEIALAFRWIDLMNNDIVEVGAVTPYHNIPKTLSHPIIDPYDEEATIQDFVENQDLTMDNVLSISTIEHIGMAGGDYDGSGLRQEVADPHASPAALQKILNESEKCLVTFPVGYNKSLDDWVENNLDRLQCFGYHKVFGKYVYVGHETHWKTVWNYYPHVESIKPYQYREPFPLGNFILCITGWK